MDNVDSLAGDGVGRTKGVLVADTPELDSRESSVRGLDCDPSASGIALVFVADDGRFGDAAAVVAVAASGLSAV